MTDKEFQKILNRLSKAHNAYRTLLQIAEAELEERFGKNPSEVDNDQWIDIYHYYGGTMSVDEVKNTMEDCIQRK